MQRIGTSSGNRTRTYDPTDMSRLLYQLSYAAKQPQASVLRTGAEAAFKCNSLRHETRRGSCRRKT